MVRREAVSSATRALRCAIRASTGYPGSLTTLPPSAAAWRAPRRPQRTLLTLQPCCTNSGTVDIRDACDKRISKRMTGNPVSRQS
eukprot:7089543-Prymnesium_polylepis.1